MFALAGPTLEKEFGKFASTPLWREMLGKRPRRDLNALLTDRARLEAMPTGSLAAAYLRYLGGDDMGSAEYFLSAADLDEKARRFGWSEDQLWFVKRMANSHDLFHVVGGHGRGLAKEGVVMIHGSCLCRGVRFEFPRAVTPIGMCHCSKCRKVSGTASNATFLVPKGELTFSVGADLLETFKLPTGWGATFCRNCGCPMPHLHQGGGAYYIPAGSLDDDPGVRVGGHIYVGSKAVWDEIAGSAPQFEEGPEAP